jgi:hypothetical protein
MFQVAEVQAWVIQVIGISYRLLGTGYRDFTSGLATTCQGFRFWVAILKMYFPVTGTR